MKYTNAVEIQNRRINLIYESIVNEGLKDVVKNTAIGGLAGAAGGVAGARIAKAVGANGKVGTTIGGAAGGALVGGGAQAAYDKFVNKRNVNWGSVGQAALGGAVTGGGVGYAMGDSKPDAKVEPPENPSGSGEQSHNVQQGEVARGTDYKDSSMTGGNHPGPSTGEYIKPDETIEVPDRYQSNDVKPADADTSTPNKNQTPAREIPKIPPKPEKRNAWGRSADHLWNGDIGKAGDDFVSAGAEAAKKTASKTIDASKEAVKTVGRVAVDAGSTVIGGAKKVGRDLATGLKNVGSAIFK